MNRFFYLIFFLFVSNLTNAQTQDTILFENFQFDNISDMPGAPTGSDTVWVNYDEDSIPPNDGVATHNRWYFREFFSMAFDPNTGETNYCAASSSFLQGSVPGNRDWLVLPPIQVTDSTFTLHWKSAPYQLPRYMDGYMVLAAADNNTIPHLLAGDTLFQAASMESIVGNGQSLDLSNFTFTPGYFHADSLTKTEYITGTSTGIRFGLLEPHSVSLAKFAGKTIYIAFLHNCDDDTEIAIDDVLIQRQTVSGTTDPAVAALRFTSYPNPVSNRLNLLYHLEQPAPVSVRLSDANGHGLRTLLQSQWQSSGEHQLDLDLSTLPGGAYQLTLQAGTTLATHLVVKK